MKKGLAAMALVATAVAAHAQTLIDNYSTALPDYTLTSSAGSYGGNSYTPINPLLGTALVGAVYGGGSGDPFTVHTPGTGTVTATGTGAASGALEITYTAGAAVDLSGYKSFTIHVDSLTAPVTVDWDFWNAGYAYSYKPTYTLSSAGDTTLNFSDLVGSVDTTKFNRLQIFIGLSAGQSVTVSDLRANAVPEPATMAGLGVGVLLISRRKRRS